MKIAAAALIGALSLVGAPAPEGENAEKLIKASDCSGCHAVDRQVVGPSYSSIAERYRGQSDAFEKVVTKIRDGGSGMTPHPDFTDPGTARRTEP